MKPRTAAGHLTETALRSGMKEQYAVLRRRGKVIIELGIAPDGVNFQVEETVINGAMSTWKGRVIEGLGDARIEFARLVNTNP